MFVTAVAEGGMAGEFIPTLHLTSGRVASLMSGTPGSRVAIKVSDDVNGTSAVVELHRAAARSLAPAGVFTTSPQTKFDMPNFPPRTNYVGQGRTNQLTPQPGIIAQPRYPAWLLLRRGMTSSEVRSLLGEPLRTREGPESAQWEYGSVQLASERTPVDLSFTVSFVKGKAVAFDDPFDGVFSTDGFPTKPSLILPHNEDRFDHFPRILDLRWYPASGIHPMNYDVQVDTEVKNHWSSQIYTCGETAVSVVFSGQNRGRCRVRACNRLGQGDWSDYRFFEFAR